MYEIYFFITAFGIVFTIRRLNCLYIDGYLSYGRFLISRQTLEALITLLILSIHFSRLCYLLSQSIQPAGFRVLWLPETLYFGSYIRGLIDEKHYAALEKALRKAFSAD